MAELFFILWLCRGGRASRRHMIYRSHGYGAHEFHLSLVRYDTWVHYRLERKLDVSFLIESKIRENEVLKVLAFAEDIGGKRKRRITLGLASQSKLNISFGCRVAEVIETHSSRGGCFQEFKQRREHLVCPN